jgi:2-dehydropantoate 2-reductase
MARRYAVVGAGAIGALYGARLAAVGHPVHFLMRSDLDHVRRYGLLVESVYGDVWLESPSVFGEPGEIPPVDVVLVGLKTTANHRLGELIGPLVSDGATVVMLQNGLRVDEQAAAVAPHSEVLGGLCFTCSNRVAPGHVRHLDYGAITLGSHRRDGRPAGITPAMEAVAADLRQAGVEIVLAEDLRQARWRKLAWNMPFNGLSVVLDTTTDRLMAHPATAQLAGHLMDEVCDAATACGSPLPPSTRDDLLALTRTMRPYATSTKLDADAGRPLELDAIYAAPLAAARTAGAPMARLEALHAQLRFLDDRAQADRCP